MTRPNTTQGLVIIVNLSVCSVVAVDFASVHLQNASAGQQFLDDTRANRIGYVQNIHGSATHTADNHVDDMINRQVVTTKRQNC
jgi:hypothetical protein